MLPKLGRDIRGGLGSELLSGADLSFSIFSKWLRNDETGFCSVVVNRSYLEKWEMDVR